MAVGASMLLLAAAAAAGPQPVLGKLIHVDGVNLLPSASLALDVPSGPQPGVYRQISLNWHDRPYHLGKYPSKAFAARRGGKVGLRLRIETDGRLAACSVTAPSGVAELDAHACPHLIANTGFHPGLDAKGRRFGGSVAASLTYSLSGSMNVLAPGDVPPPEPHRDAKPPESITLATLGIGKDIKPRRSIGGISATLAIAADGNVAACTVESPTFIDAVDTEACSRLLAMRFRPAEDAAGRAVASRYTVSLPFPR